MKLALLALLFAPMIALAAPASYDIKIDGMTCDDCANAVKKALSRVPNVDPKTVTVVLKENKASIVLKEAAKDSEAAIRKAIEGVGMKVTSVQVASK